MLFRHGKSDAPSLQHADFDRGLTSRGVANARRMGEFVRDHIKLPDIILVSTARRTSQTYELAAEAWPDIPVVFSDKIYEASASTLLLLVEEVAADYGSVMIIGHNPGLVVLLNLSVGSRHTDGNLSHFPSCSVADIGFEAPKLGDIEINEGRLLSIKRVRDLEASALAKK
ncbi:histidine phosphatase family protein [Alphaproteobacteria bacterium]|nr:histidine phosphatase family protein [Alphaproteobacteria bacterium]